MISDRVSYGSTLGEAINASAVSKMSSVFVSALYIIKYNFIEKWVRILYPPQTDLFTDTLPFVSFEIIVLVCFYHLTYKIWYLCEVPSSRCPCWNMKLKCFSHLVNAHHNSAGYQTDCFPSCWVDYEQFMWVYFAVACILWLQINLSFASARAGLMFLGYWNDWLWRR